MIKAIFFDIDGTLLDHSPKGGGRIPPSTLRCLEALRKKGIKLFVATGRIPAMVTFLEHFDLTGKRILPFCTNEGSGMGHSEQDLNQVCTGATVEPGLSIRGCQAAGSRDQVADWVKHLL